MANDRAVSKRNGPAPEDSEDNPSEPEDQTTGPFFCDPQPTSAHLCAQIRECDWAQFKNVSENEALFVADALATGPNLNLQVLDENIKRGKTVPARRDSGLFFVNWIPSHNKWIHRIRIRSAAVLDLLNKVSGDSWDSSKAHTFMRPFGYLIHHQDAVRHELSVLEGDSTTTDLSPDQDTQLGEIRSYVEFVEKSLLPLYSQFEAVQDGSKKVMFDDLWYLFRSGELVYVDLFENVGFETLKGKDAYVSSMQKIWRVADIRPHEVRVRYDTVFSESWVRLDIEEDSTSSQELCWFSGPKPPERIVGWFTVYCYYLDFDGERYFPVWKAIAIPPFYGERAISSLGMYPIRFSREAERVQKEAMHQGDSFVRCVERKHMWYNGFFLVREPTGRMMQGRKGDVQDTSEFTGEVYIDVKEALNHRIQWKSLSHASQPHEVASRIFIESYPIMAWSGSERKHALRSSYEIVVLNDDVHRFQFNKYLELDPYISTDRGISAHLFPYQHADRALLPRRIFAYIFRYQNFVPIDVNDLEPLRIQPKAFDGVIFKETSKMKDQLNALLDAYFERKRALTHTSTMLADDIVWGKGGGLVILLQGAPGTGKTATVEAIAQSRGKPLIVVTPDDASDDIVLNVIFSLAAKWDCIVLLDEVDVLMGRRIPGQLGGNIWVSRLLRHLETFTGILFLTTMRPGVLDEGVKSRVHLNLCYQPLDERQTISVFKLHLDQLSRLERLQHEACPSYQPLGILEPDILDFAQQHYQANSVKMGRWNGRQIRNAVRVAAAIAHFAYRDKPGLQPQLQAEHFRKVAELTKEYDKTRQNATGTTDYGLSLRQGERCDVDTPKPTGEPQTLATPQHQMQKTRPANWEYERDYDSHLESTADGNIDAGGYDYDAPNATQQLPIGDGRRGRDPISGEGGKLGQGLTPRMSFGSGPSSAYGRRLVARGWDQDD